MYVQYQGGLFYVAEFCSEDEEEGKKGKGKGKGGQEEWPP